MDQENKNTTPEEELMTEETAEAVEAAEPAEEAAPEQKKGKKKKSREAEALEKCEAEKKELEDRYLRLMAEYDNYRRRTQKERENVYPMRSEYPKRAAAAAGYLQPALEYPLVPMKIISPASR